MRNMLKAEKFKFFHSCVLWVIIGVLLAFCCISIMTGVYNSAESALLNISKDIVVPLLGCSVYSAILLQNAAVAIGVSVATTIFLGVFTNRLYTGNGNILKYSPVIQLNGVAVNPISGEYLIAVAISFFVLGSCLCGSIIKFRRTQY